MFKCLGWPCPTSPGVTTGETVSDSQELEGQFIRPLQKAHVLNNYFTSALRTLTLFVDPMIQFLNHIYVVAGRGVRAVEYKYN